MGKLMHKTKRLQGTILALVFFLAFAAFGMRDVRPIHAAGIAADDGAYVVNDVVRVQPLSETLVRLEEKGPKGFEDRDTYYVVGRGSFGKVESTQTEDDANYYVETKSYKVRIPKTVTGLDGVTVTDKNGKTLYTYASDTTANTYLPSPSDELSCWYMSDSPRIIPSEDGYSAIDTDRPFNGWDFDNKASDMYVFLPQGNYKQFCADYTKLTGPSELVDLKTLGYWDSRWYAYSAETALQQVQDYLDRGYSIDMLVIDTDWRKATESGIGYDINTQLFPDMAAFLEEAHGLGVNITFNDHPEPVKGTTNGLDKSEIAYRSKNLKLILSLGLDFWWYDRNWSVALNSADSDLSVFAFGMYAFQFITEEYYQSIADVDAYARRALIMANVDGCLHGNWIYASDLSAHRYSIQWTGDIGANEKALAMEIRNAVFGSAENGIPYVSSDIGGHNQAVTDNMYSRWMQYGALSTICRVHCTHEKYIHQEGRMPWLFGETAENVTKEYIGMRYRLLPLYYTLAAENYRTGLPILRRLDIEYPQYAEASRNDEYLLGDGILIAPIADADAQKSAPATWFTCNDDGTTKQGLLGEYFNNNALSGEPAYTKVDTDFMLDWGTGGPSGLGSDNFSIRWKGNFKVGDSAACLQFYADDCVIVLIDGKQVVHSGDVYDVLFSTPYYAAGTEHTIEIRYYEDAGNAHFYMYGAERPTAGASVCYNTRTVFIPDGVWTDVWTGKRFEGPRTYTVTHGLETSPIFVKQGSLTVLAEDMQNTSQKDWSNVALDVHPTLSGTASTSLYEDDTQTVAYKDGKFRTTDIDMAFDTTAQALKINIGAAEGEFTGDRAFTTRTWNVRIHAYEELGGVTGVKVDGRPVAMRYFKRKPGVSPFAFTGAANDSDVYELAFTGDVYRAHTVEVTFADNAAFAAAAQADTGYDATETAFTVSAERAGNLLDLDNEKFTDWAYFGQSGAIARKQGVEHVIGDVTSEFQTYSFGDNQVMTGWTNAEGQAQAEEITTGIGGQVDLDLTLSVAPDGAKYYIVYCSGYKCLAKLSVRDRAGNVQTLTFGNLAGAYTYRAVIEVNPVETSQLYVKYMVYSGVPDGTGSPSRVSLSAVAAASTLPEMENMTYAAVTASVEAQETINAVTKVSLTDNGTALGVATRDWFKSGHESADKVYKAGADDILSVNYSSSQVFTDYAAAISWSDGEEVASGVETRRGLCTTGAGRIEIAVRVNADTGYIRLYTGCWRSTNTVTVYDMEGNVLATSTPFSAGDSSVCKALTFKIDAAGASRVRIVIQSSAERDNGNVSLSAVTVLGKKA